MVLEKIETKTLRQKTYEQISENILAGTMPPGKVFSLRELSAKLDISTMPVREALWQLETDNIIKIENNKRMYINTVTPKELEDIFHLRLFLESELAIRACDTRTNETISAIATTYTNLKQNIDILPEYLLWNYEFHFQLYKHSDSEVLLNTTRRLWLRIAPYFAMKKDESPSHVQLKPHTVMFESLINRDKKGILRALETDMHAAYEYISQLIN